MFAQLFHGAARGGAVFGAFGLADLHEGHAHFLQIGDVLFQVLERVLDLQREQAAQAGAVFGSGRFRLVKHFDGDGIAGVNQGRETNQGLAALADFQ